MTVKLSKESADPRHASGESEREVADPDAKRTYPIVDCDTYRRARRALRRQQDRDAIAQGIAEMEAGEGTSLDEAISETRSKLALRQ